MRRMLGAAVAGLAYVAALAGASADEAADFPNRPVKIVVGVAPGASSDMLSRTLARKLGEIWGHQVVVENVPGASSNIGLKQVAQSAPDGYTLVNSGTTLALNANLFTDLGYDPAKDFAAVTEAASSPQILVTRPDLGPKTLQEYLALAKAKDGGLLFGLPGNGGIAHIANELLSQRTGTRVTYIPYKGGAPATADLLGGHTDAIITLAAVTEHVRAGKLTAIAVTTDTRSTALPDVPTFAESGVPGYAIGSWQGFFAPAATPRPIIEKLHRDFVTALNAPEVKSFLEDQGFVVKGTPPAETDALVQKEIGEFGEIIRAANISLTD